MKRNKKITLKELNIKKDWIVIRLNHERYSFDIACNIYRDKTILDILKDNYVSDLVNRIERAGYHGYAYAIDEIYHQDLDSDTWCLTEQEKKRFLPLNIDAFLIAELDKFLEYDSLNWSFGDTFRKYGVMDYAKYPVEMDEEKDNQKW